MTRSVHAYNPETDSWRDDVADFPVEFHHPNVAVVDSVLYVLGFHPDEGEGADGRTYSYHPRDNIWTARTPQPRGTERGSSCVTAFEREIFVFGGSNDDALRTASVYNPADGPDGPDGPPGSWSELPDLPQPLHHCIAGVYDLKIYLVSGRSESYDQAVEYNPDPPSSYASKAIMPRPRTGAAGGSLGEFIFVFGGKSNVDNADSVFREVEQYDPEADLWTSSSQMTVPRHGFGAAVIGDCMYLPGGSTESGQTSTAHTAVHVDSL